MPTSSLSAGAPDRRPLLDGVIDPREAVPFVAPHARRTPMLSSRLIGDATGLRVSLKAELFQRTGSFKLRGALFKLARLSPEERARGVICSSAGNHAQGVALAASIFGVPATVAMGENATPSKVQATKGYGAEVVRHGTLWDETDAYARELAEAKGLTVVHPFDDYELIAGQGTVGVEIAEDVPDVEVVVVPIGGGGLISGVATAIKLARPEVRIVGVESAGAPGMQLSLRQGAVVTLDSVETAIDGLRLARKGERNFEIVSAYVDEIVTVSDAEAFEAVVWLMTHCKVVAEGAAAATVAALLNRRIDLPPSTRVVAILSGGNLDVSRLAGMVWN